jgi:hypothetical protein
MPSLYSLAFLSLESFAACVKPVSSLQGRPTPDQQTGAELFGSHAGVPEANFRFDYSQTVVPVRGSSSKEVGIAKDTSTYRLHGGYLLPPPLDQFLFLILSHHS